MTGIEDVVWGVLGGCAVECFTVYSVAHRPKNRRPKWLYDKLYWVSRAGMALVGGFLVLGYMRSGVTVNPILAFNIGASAPLGIKTLMVPAPSQPGKTY